MGKKYLNTKEGSIEQSVLAVWQEAADMHSEGMDGRTTEYRSHRSKLEANRVRRENKRKSVKVEQPETLDGAGEHAYEIGTDRYAEYTQKLTPGQIKEEDFINEKSAKYLEIEFKDSTTAANAYKYINHKIEPGGTQPWDDFNQEGSSLQFDNMRDADSLMKELKGKFKFKVYEREEVEEVNCIKEGINMENRNLTDTIKNLWIEAAAAAVDPKEREELDLAPEDTAKKMKRAKEPAPNVSESEELGEGTKEEYQKFFQGALKKFKIKSPAELKSDEEKKKFFDYVDKNYTGEKDEEKIEEKIELAKEFKVSSMRQALEKVWSVAEGELPPALKKAIDAKKKDKEKKENNDEKDDDEKKGNTMTGKKKAAVDVNPHQSYH